MSDSNEAYIKLITSEHATKPNFVSYVETFLDLVSPIVDCYNSFSTIFNLQNAVGDQLDIIGTLVGVSRELPINVAGIPSTLSDEYFKKVITSKILQNHWDGTRQGIENIIVAIYPNVPFEIIDNQDMSYSVTLLTSQLDAVDQALILNGYILPKPSGVRVSYNIMEAQLFGWDVDTGFIGGWDKGVWQNA